METVYPGSSVISILPYEIRESKPNLYPGNFTIPAGNVLAPGVLSVAVSRFYIPMAFGAPSMTAHSPAYEVARSIVNDYVGALLGAGEDMRPGIFVVDKRYKSSEEAKADLINELPKHLEAQRKWFFSLVNMADQDFRKHGRIDAVSDLQKLAAKELNIRDRPWLQDITQLSINNCPACFAPVNALAAICGSCRYVLDEAKYAKMKFATTEVVNNPTNIPVGK